MLRRIFRNFCWHKWKLVYEKAYFNFLGERCHFFHKAFRICEKCGRAQEYKECFISVDTPPDCQWRDLTDCEAKILKRKVVDMGGYYILNDEEACNGH